MGCVFLRVPQEKFRDSFEYFFLTSLELVQWVRAGATASNLICSMDNPKKETVIQLWNFASSVSLQRVSMLYESMPVC